MDEISGNASKEYSLEKAMEKMKNEWTDMQFEFHPYRDSVSTITCINIYKTMASTVLYKIAIITTTTNTMTSITTR